MIDTFAWPIWRLTYTMSSPWAIFQEPKVCRSVWSVTPSRMVVLSSLSAFSLARLTAGLNQRS